MILFVSFDSFDVVPSSCSLWDYWWFRDFIIPRIKFDIGLIGMKFYVKYFSILCTFGSEQIFLNHHTSLSSIFSCPNSRNLCPIQLFYQNHLLQCLLQPINLDSFEFLWLKDEFIKFFFFSWVIQSLFYIIALFLTVSDVFLEGQSNLMKV